MNALTPVIGFTPEQINTLNRLRQATEMPDASAMLAELVEIYRLVMLNMPNDEVEASVPERVTEAMKIYQQASEAAYNGEKLGAAFVDPQPDGSCVVTIRTSIMPLSLKDIFEKAFRDRKVATERRANIRLAAANASAPPA